MDPSRAARHQAFESALSPAANNDQNQTQRKSATEVALTHLHKNVFPVEDGLRTSSCSSPTSRLASARTTSPPISRSSQALAGRPPITALTTPSYSFHSIDNLARVHLPDAVSQTAPPFHRDHHARILHHHHQHAPHHHTVQRRLLGSLKPQSSVEAIFSQIAANIAVPQDGLWRAPHRDAETGPQKLQELADTTSADHSDSGPGFVSVSSQENSGNRSDTTSIHSKSSSSIHSSDTQSLADQQLVTHPSDVEGSNTPGKRENLKKICIGLVQFLRTPLGIAVAIYGALVVFWGAALVLILMSAISMSNKQQHFWVEICSQILNGLFTITGIGLIPWRVRDTYYMSVIASHFQRRKRSESPTSSRKDPSPSEVASDNADQQTHSHFERCLKGFCTSQKWFRPFETETHNAFPLRAAAGVCALNDLNSIFQICLCTAMWGWNSHERPPWTTALLIPLSFLCGIGAAIIIWHYGRRSKKLYLEGKREKEHRKRVERQRRLRRHGQHRLPEKWFFERD